jgi:acyl-coenzyme A synthetase/AMP-(fatty) acid ligase
MLCDEPFVVDLDAADEATTDQAAVIEELRLHVAKVICPVAKPRQTILTPKLPKT